MSWHTGYAIFTYKMRLSLEEYNLSASAGLRFLFCVPTDKDVVPLFIYKKGTIREHEVINTTMRSIRFILQELS